MLLNEGEMKMDAILLGAGLSKRMGRQKLLLPFCGKTVIETVIASLRGAGIKNIYAVLSREVAQALPKPPEWLKTRVNESPERGQSSSLALGLAMLGEGRDFCIMLGDLPLVPPDAIAALELRFRSMPPAKTLLAPCREGAFGHPMFFRALWRARFHAAERDEGGRNIVARYESEIERIEAPDCHFRDMDVPDEYEAACRAVSGVPAPWKEI